MSGMYLVDQTGNKLRELCPQARTLQVSGASPPMHQSDLRSEMPKGTNPIEFARTAAMQSQRQFLQSRANQSASIFFCSSQSPRVSTAEPHPLLPLPSSKLNTSHLFKSMVRYIRAKEVTRNCMCADASCFSPSLPCITCSMTLPVGITSRVPQVCHAFVLTNPRGHAAFTALDGPLDIRWRKT